MDNSSDTENVESDSVENTETRETQNTEVLKAENNLINRENVFFQRKRQMENVAATIPTLVGDQIGSLDSTYTWLKQQLTECEGRVEMAKNTLKQKYRVKVLWQTGLKLYRLRPTNAGMVRNAAEQYNRVIKFLHEAIDDAALDKAHRNEHEQIIQACIDQAHTSKTHMDTELKSVKQINRLQSCLFGVLNKKKATLKPPEDVYIGSSNDAMKEKCIVDYDLEQFRMLDIDFYNHYLDTLNKARMDIYLTERVDISVDMECYVEPLDKWADAQSSDANALFYAIFDSIMRVMCKARRHQIQKLTRYIRTVFRNIGDETPPKNLHDIPKPGCLHDIPKPRGDKLTEFCGMFAVFLEGHVVRANTERIQEILEHLIELLEAIDKVDENKHVEEALQLQMAYEGQKDHLGSDKMLVFSDDFLMQVNKDNYEVLKTVVNKEIKQRETNLTHLDAEVISLKQEVIKNQEDADVLKKNMRLMAGKIGGTDEIDGMELEEPGVPPTEAGSDSERDRWGNWKFV